MCVGGGGMKRKRLIGGCGDWWVVSVRVCVCGGGSKKEGADWVVGIWGLCTGGVKMRSWRGSGQRRDVMRGRKGRDKGHDKRH